MPRLPVIPRLACLALLVGGGCLTVPPQTGPNGASDSEAATGTTTVTSGSAGQSETGVVAPATSTSTSTAANITTSAASGATSEAATAFDTHGFVWSADEGEPERCDIFAQDCPRGQKCMPYGEDNFWDSTRCVDVVADPKQVGEECTAFGGPTGGEDDCDLGALCWEVDEDDHGVCIATCGGTPDAPVCPPESSCTGSRSALSICIPICNPLVQDCPTDDLCVFLGDHFTCLLDASGEQGQAHDPCELINACDKGLLCLDSVSASSQCDPAAVGCCEPFCMFPDGPCPAADQKCVQWFDPQMLPADDPNLAIGVCAIPF